MKFVIQCASAMIGNATVLEVPTREVDAKEIANLANHIANLFPNMTKDEIKSAVDNLFNVDMKRHIMNSLIPFMPSKENRVSRTEIDSAIAEYHQQNNVDDAPNFNDVDFEKYNEDKEDDGDDEFDDSRR